MEVKPFRTIAAVSLSGIGALLVILGVALVFVPAAVVLAGVALFATGFFVVGLR